MVLVFCVSYVADGDDRIDELVDGYSDPDVDECASENISSNGASASDSPLKFDSINYLSQ